MVRPNIEDVDLEKHVFILYKPNHDSNSPDNEVKEIQGVVLPSRKILGQHKQHLEMNMTDAKRYWEEDGNSGEIPLEELFTYLLHMNGGAYSTGILLPTNDAREFVKKGGGI